MGPPLWGAKVPVFRAWTALSRPPATPQDGGGREAPRTGLEVLVSMDGVILAHGSGGDELLILVFPVVVGLGFWLITRQKPAEDEGADDSPKPS